MTDLLALFAAALSEREGDARGSVSYAQGCVVARQLVNVDYDAFVAHENAVLFLKLSNAVCMHAR
ncbi:hypothetical protein EON65_48155 [archaeon]|nr:MAG: hypothetical protein EON65_48155 [archaeon]